MLQLVLTAAADAFLDVGVVLAVVALVVLVLGDRCHAIGDLVTRHRHLGPLLGAALGATPGCSGALLLVPLFLRGKVSAGTLTATLLATTGDSAWALWAGAPRAAFVVHAAVFLTGVTVGLAVDASRLGRVLEASVRRGASVAPDAVVAGAVGLAAPPRPTTPSA